MPEESINNITIMWLLLQRLLLLLLLLFFIKLWSKYKYMIKLIVKSTAGNSSIYIRYIIVQWKLCENFGLQRHEKWFALYISKTFRYIKVRVSEHQFVSLQTCKPLKGTFFTPIRNNLFECDDHKEAWNNFTIPGSSLANPPIEIK